MARGYSAFLGTLPTLKGNLRREVSEDLVMPVQHGFNQRNIGGVPLDYQAAGDTMLVASTLRQAL